MKRANSPMAGAQIRPVSRQALLTYYMRPWPRFKPGPELGSRGAATHGSIDSAGSKVPQPKPMKRANLPVLRTGPSLGKHFLLMLCGRAHD